MKNDCIFDDYNAFTYKNNLIEIYGFSLFILNFNIFLFDFNIFFI